MRFVALVSLVWWVIAILQRQLLIRLVRLLKKASVFLFIGYFPIVIMIRSTIPNIPPLVNAPIKVIAMSFHLSVSTFATAIRNSFEFL